MGLFYDILCVAAVNLTASLLHWGPIHWIQEGVAEKLKALGAGTLKCGEGPLRLLQ